MKLYKYYAVNEFSFTALMNEYVWYSSPESFNDPFDTKIVEHLCLPEFKNLKILCLSATHTNLLMWSHYAKSHTGFCVEFTEYTEQDLEILKEKKIYPSDATLDMIGIGAAKPITYMTSDEIDYYTSTIPKNNKDLTDLYNSLKDNEQKKLIECIQNTVFIKHIDWSYEQEYRILSFDHNTSDYPGKISAIYFGMNMNQEHKRAIAKLLIEKTRNHPMLFQMDREEGKYSLSFRPFEMTKDCKDLNVVY